MTDNTDILLLDSPKQVLQKSIVVTIVLIILTICFDIFYLKDSVKQIRSSEVEVLRMAGYVPLVLSYKPYSSKSHIPPEEVDPLLNSLNAQIKKTLASDANMRNDELGTVMLSEEEIAEYLKIINSKIKNDFYPNWETKGIDFSLREMKKFKENISNIFLTIEAELANTPQALFEKGIRIPKETLVEKVPNRWILYLLPLLLGLIYYCREMVYRFEVKHGFNFDWNLPSLSVMPGGPPDASIPSSFGRTFTFWIFLGFILNFGRILQTWVYQYKYTFDDATYFLST